MTRKLSFSKIRTFFHEKGHNSVKTHFTAKKRTFLESAGQDASFDIFHDNINLKIIVTKILDLMKLKMGLAMSKAMDRANFDILKILKQNIKK